MSFGIATIVLNDEPTPALLVGGRLWPVGPAAREAGLPPPEGVVFDYLQRWDETLPRLRQLAARIAGGGVSPAQGLAREGAHFETPVSLPRKVFCVGANYSDHLEEMGVPRHLHPDPANNPFFFLKPGSTAIVGPGPTVQMPAKCDLFDWEAEVVAVFGRRGRNIPAARALDYVAGYTLAIDFTSRNQMAIPEHPMKWDLVLGKCQDAMTPVGPVLVPKEFVDGDDFHFSLSVNGVVKQAASTRDMIHSLARQIAAISEGFTIEPGDILLTGSPAGVGMPRGERLSPGDRVVVESAITGPMQVVIQAPLAALAAA